MLSDTPAPLASHAARGPRRSGAAIVRWLPILLIGLATLAAPLISLASDTYAGPDDEALRSGADVYAEACAACHQPGGTGLVDQFPPLVGNPNIDDAGYIDEVIRNGLSGEIEVSGQIYDGVMPSQSTLSDDDINDVVAYIQSGFAVPAAPVTEVSDDTGGSDLPTGVKTGIYVALAVALVGSAVVFAPRIIGVIDRRTVPWPDAWMKTVVIVVGLILLTTFIPNWVIESEALKETSRTTRDLITVGVWAVGLCVGLFALWRFQRNRRI